MSRKPRDIRIVIDAMLEEIPHHEALIFRGDLQKVIDSIPYIAPEAEQLLWFRLQLAVNTYLPQPRSLSSWEINVVAAYTDRTAAQVMKILATLPPF